MLLMLAYYTRLVTVADMFDTDLGYPEPYCSSHEVSVLEGRRPSQEGVVVSSHLRADYNLILWSQYLKQIANCDGDHALDLSGYQLSMLVIDSLEV